MKKQEKCEEDYLNRNEASSVKVMCKDKRPKNTAHMVVHMYATKNEIHNNN